MARDLHAVFRVVLRMCVDGDDAEYQLTMRTYGSLCSATIKRIVPPPHDETSVGLPFDAVAVELAAGHDKFQMTTVFGDYIAIVAFLKRSRSGTILSCVKARVFLSATSGVQGELLPAASEATNAYIFAAQAPDVTSDFAIAVRDAVASLASWKVDVECARVTTRTLCGFLTLEGYIKSGSYNPGDRWWTPVRLSIEFLPDNTLQGMCVGEAFCSKVTGVWRRNKLDMSMDFRRSATYPTTRLRLECIRVSGHRILEDWPIAYDSDTRLVEVELEIARLGLGPSLPSHTIQPFDFYQQARLAVLSSFRGNDNAAHLLPTSLWQRIFSFYDETWFSSAEKQSFARPDTKAVDDTTMPESVSCVAIPVESPVVDQHKYRDFLRSARATTADFARSHWVASLYMGVAVSLLMLLVQPSPMAPMLTVERTNSTPCGSSSFPFLITWSNHGANLTNGTPSHDGAFEEGIHYGIASSSRLWPLLVLVFAVNTGLALLPRSNPGVLISFLVGTGFLSVHHLAHRPGSFVATPIFDIVVEVAILLAALGWVYKPALTHAFSSWERLPMQSRLAIWSGHYTLPFFIAANSGTIKGAIQSIFIQPVSLPQIHISSRVGVLSVGVGSIVLAEAIKPVLAVILRQPRPCLLRQLARACLFAVAVLSMCVFSTVILPRHLMLGIFFIPCTSQPTKVAAATQAILLGAFVQGFASFLDHIHHLP